MKTTVTWADAAFYVTITSAVVDADVRFEPALLQARAKRYSSISHLEWLAATVGSSYEQNMELRFDHDTRHLVGFSTRFAEILRTVEGSGDDIWRSWPARSGRLALPGGVDAPDINLRVAALSSDARLLILGMGAEPHLQASRLDIFGDVALLVHDNRIVGVACYRPLEHLLGGKTGHVTTALSTAVVETWRLWAEKLAFEVADKDLPADFETRRAVVSRTLRDLGPAGEIFADWLTWI